MPDKVTSATNLHDVTFTVGDNVRHSDGWTGTIIDIVEPGENSIHPVRLRVEPDNVDELRGHDRERPLNDMAAARAGRYTTCRPRDEGLSMGNFVLLSMEQDEDLEVTSTPMAP